MSLKVRLVSFAPFLFCLLIQVITGTRIIYKILYEQEQIIYKDQQKTNEKINIFEKHNLNQIPGFNCNSYKHTRYP